MILKTSCYDLISFTLRIRAIKRTDNSIKLSVLIMIIRFFYRIC